MDFNVHWTHNDQPDNGKHLLYVIGKQVIIIGICWARAHTMNSVKF